MLCTNETDNDHRGLDFPVEATGLVSRSTTLHLQDASAATDDRSEVNENEAKNKSIKALEWQLHAGIHKECEKRKTEFKLSTCGKYVKQVLFSTYAFQVDILHLMSKVCTPSFTMMF